MATNIQTQAKGFPGSAFASNGFCIVSDVLSSSDCDVIGNLLSTAFESERQQRRGRTGGLRNILSMFPMVRETAWNSKILGLARDAAEQNVFPVRAIFFDKTPEANWGVPWHQDLSIAVADRIETPGFSGWSSKDSVQHVQPPVEILEGMVTVRIHLDDCMAVNGALRVIPGSHRSGKISGEETDRWGDANAAFTCEVKKGDALLMRPLLLHASLPAKNPAHRRVLHIEYAGGKLPGGLRWLEEVAG